MSRNLKTVKNSIFVMTAVLITAVFGIFRDVLIAKDFGIGIKADIFFAAFVIPYIFNGVINKAAKVTFVPIFSEVLTQSGEKKLFDTFNSIINIFLIIAPCLILFFYFTCPVFTKLFFPGFKKEYLPILSHIFFILSFTMAINCVVAIQSSFLNLYSYFFIPSIVKALMNITIIMFILILVNKWSIYGLAWSYLIGEAVQPIFLFVHCRKTGYRFRFKIKLDESIKKGFKNMAVPVFTFLTRRSTLLIERSMASFLIVGSISALGFSYRIIIGILTLVSFSFFTTTLPTLSELSSKTNPDELHHYIESNIKMIFFISFPIMIILLFFNMPIIKLLFQRNNFDGTAVIMTSNALFYYSIGIAAFCQISSILSIFYSFQDQWTPFKHLMLIMTVNLVLDIIFMKRFGYVGIAMASSVCNWLSFFRLRYLLKKHYNFKTIPNLNLFYQQLLMAALSMIGAVVISASFINNFILLSAIGIGVYILTSYFLKMKEVRFVVQKICSRIVFAQNKAVS